jgi:hypothetical protein
MKTNELLNIETVFSVLDSIIKHAEKVAQYESELAVYEKINELNEAMYQKDSRIFAELTKNYHMKKFKLERMKKRVLQVSPQYQALINPLLEGLEKEVKKMQFQRNSK